MNKKKLSVVMAGAMLASSVAPVLAATESELDTSRLGSLVEKVYEKLTSERFTAGTGDKEAGKSVYGVKIKGEATINAKIDALTVAGKEEELRITLQEAFKDLTADDKVEIWSKGTATDEKGNLVSQALTTPVYTAAEIKAQLATTIAGQLMPSSSTNIISKTGDVAFADGKISIKFQSGVKFNADNIEGYEFDAKTNTLYITAGNEKIDFANYLNDKGEKVALASTTTASLVKGFAKVAPTGTDVADTLEETVKITGTTHNYKTTDLYDGLMLTTEGHEMLSLVKSIRHDKETATTKTTAVIKNLSKTVDYTAGKNIDLSKVKGEYGFILSVKDGFGKTTEYVVKGAEKQTEVLASWLNTELAKVDILAGDNRYETAVKIAKEQAQVATPDAAGSNVIENIVLVNGNALVDGLSAAPLAATLTDKKAGNGTQAAPVLLTEADALPKATKAYLVELMTNHVIGDKNTAKIHLVGGTTVLNRSLEKELESMGFEVVRYNGDNREETSLKVAEVVESKSANKTQAFVVGAEGEADAMSISGYASSKKIPVIVSKKGGLTYEGLEAISNKAVTVIGGENAVSASEYEAIKEEATAVRRISGSDRQATNAAIIKEFYHDTTTLNGINQESVIVAKDGKGNKSALVDALTAANLAAQTNAPVVLATDKLSDDQIDAIRLRAQKADSLYQVGHGVDRSVMETIASKLGLLNK